MEVRAGSSKPVVASVVKRAVKERMEQILVEVVLGVRALKEYWDVDHQEALLSEEALTASVIPRWFLDTATKRDLGQQLGTLSNRWIFCLVVGDL